MSNCNGAKVYVCSVDVHDLQVYNVAENGTEELSAHGGPCHLVHASSTATHCLWEGHCPQRGRERCSEERCHQAAQRRAGPHRLAHSCGQTVPGIKNHLMLYTFN